MPSACEADEGGLWNRREPRRAGQCPAPTKKKDRFRIRRRGGYQPPALEISATVEAARKPSPLGEGAERSEADEVCSGGYTGPPGSYHQRKPQGTPLPINGLMLVLYCKGRRFPTEDSLCKKERAVQTDSAFSSLI